MLEQQGVDTESELMRLSDEELIREIYKVLDPLPTDLPWLDELYWLLQEGFERWAFEAACADRARELREDGLEDEIEDTLLTKRDRAAARLLARVLPEQRPS